MRISDWSSDVCSSDLVTVERKEAPAVTLRLAKLDGEEDYLLASSTQNYLFRAAKYAVQPLVDAKREGLVKAAQAKPKSTIQEKQGGGKQAGEDRSRDHGYGKESDRQRHNRGASELKKK